MDNTINPQLETYNFLLKAEKNDEGLHIEVEDKENNFQYSKVLNNKDSIQNLSDELSFGIESVYKVLLNQTLHKSQTSSLTLTKEGKLIYRCELPIVFGFSIDLDKKERMPADPYLNLSLLFEKLSTKVLKLEEEIERRKKVEEEQTTKEDDKVSKEIQKILSLKLEEVEKRLDEVEKATKEVSQRMEDNLRIQKSFNHEEILKAIDEKVSNAVENGIHQRYEARLKDFTQQYEELQSSFQKNWVSQSKEMKILSKEIEKLLFQSAAMKEDLQKKINDHTNALMQNYDHKIGELKQNILSEVESIEALKAILYNIGNLSVDVCHFREEKAILEETLKIFQEKVNTLEKILYSKHEERQFYSVNLEKTSSEVSKIDKSKNLCEIPIQALEKNVQHFKEIDEELKIAWKWDEKISKGFSFSQDNLFAEGQAHENNAFTIQHFPHNKNSSIKFSIVNETSEFIKEESALLTVGLAFSREFNKPENSILYSCHGRILIFGTLSHFSERYWVGDQISFQVNLETGFVIIKKNGKNVCEYNLHHDLLQKEFYPFANSVIWSRKYALFGPWQGPNIKIVES